MLVCGILGSYMEAKFKLRQKVWFTVADTSPLGGVDIEA